MEVNRPMTHYSYVYLETLIYNYNHVLFCCQANNNKQVKNNVLSEYPINPSIDTLWRSSSSWHANIPFHRYVSSYSDLVLLLADTILKGRVSPLLWLIVTQHLIWETNSAPYCLAHKHDISVYLVMLYYFVSSASD